MTAAVRRGAGVLLSLALATGAAGCTTSPPARPDATIHHYVALGDGFTAAPYAGRSSDRACLRSQDNYPALLAEGLRIAHVKDVSCTGATTTALTQRTRPVDGDSKVAPQFDALSRDTDLVTLGIGIGDRDLLAHMFAMCTAAPCGARIAPQSVADDLDEVGASLTEAVRAIQVKAPTAYIVLVGYPQIPPDGGHCPGLPPLDADGLALAGSVIAQLNAAIQSSARETGSSYLDTAALSEGHALCSSSPWVSGRKGEPGTSVPFHPVAAEQRAVATALATLVRTR